jgi:hypothetical protein
VPGGQGQQTAAGPDLWEQRLCAGVRAAAAAFVRVAALLLLLCQAGARLVLLLVPQDPLLSRACVSSCPWCGSLWLLQERGRC